MKKINKIVKLLLLAIAFLAFQAESIYANQAIMGTVFQDYNGNGILDNTGSGAIDVGVGGVTVTAYRSNGTIANSTGAGVLTSANGTYSITAITGNGTGGQFRLEFTNLPTGYFPSAQSTQAGTTVQFVPDLGAVTSNVNLAINHPDDYCQNNPDVCVNQYVNGNNADVTSTPNNLSGIWRIPYSITGDGPDLLSTSPNRQMSIANKNQVGSVWGLAYSKTRKKLYSASFLKRHVGIENGNYGGIYYSDVTSLRLSQTPNANLLLSITAGGVGIRGLVGISTSVDANAFPNVGKVGLGDIEFSQDENTLYVVNLFDRRLYPISINTTGTVGTTGTPVIIPTPANCVGQWRPFAIGRYRGDIYVGGVCDASGSTSANLKAVVYHFNTTTNSFTTTPVIDFPLNYSKGNAVNPLLPVFSGCASQKNWFPWSDVVQTMPINCAAYIYPQPMLTDLVFDNNGSMILGFADRAGHQFGKQNTSPTGTGTLYNMVGGDILRARRTNSFGFTLENNATADIGPTAGANLGQGPGNGEFYYGESLPGNHDETSEGGLAMLPGAADVVATSMDPGNTVNTTIETGGLIWLRNTGTTAGSKAKGYQVHGRYDPGTLGKSNGVGDVELLCDSAPIQIGNRVWLDSNADGIQGSGEPGIPNVVVRLFDSANAPIALATTNSNGEYYFSSGPGITNAYAIYGLNNIQPNKNYEIRLDSPLNVVPLTGLFVTVQNAPPNVFIDSDATNVTNSSGSPAGTFPVIKFTTGQAGANNHTYDIGFSNSPIPDTCCDKLKVTPMPNPPLNQDYKIFEIYNYKQPSSPICSVDIDMQPAPHTVTWQGGLAYQNTTIGYPTSAVNFVFDTIPTAYRRLPTYPPLANPNMAAISNPINSPAVKFNLGFDNTKAYNGKTILTVNHCDGTKCILVYEPWIVNPPTQGGGGFGGGSHSGQIPWIHTIRELTAELVEVTLTLESGRERIRLPEGGKGANFMSLRLAKEGLQVYSIDGAETTSERTDRKKVALNSSTKTQNSALFEFSGLMNLSGREQNGRTITVLIKKRADQKIDAKDLILTTFDQNANIILSGNPR